MKLTDDQAQQVAGQLEGQAIPEEHPNAAQLREAIGDHTFFVNADGLLIVETGMAEAGPAEASAFRIGSWSQETQGSLYLHEPQATDVTVALAPGADGAAPQQ